MLNVRFVPVQQWPGSQTPKRKNAPFRSRYSQTLDLMEEELGKIGAKEILIQAYFQLKDLRNDGWPRATAKPSAPGVVLTFKRSGETVSMPCDRYLTFEDNMRAIALSLQALRAVDRYGVTTRGEQYRGFTALPPAPKTAIITMDEAVAVLAKVLNSTVAYVTNRTGDPTGRADLRRMASRATHPDLGGSHEEFIAVTAACDLIDSWRGSAR